jgi:hypothetical protein
MLLKGAYYGILFWLTEILSKEKKFDDIVKKKFILNKY